MTKFSTGGIRLLLGMLAATAVAVAPCAGQTRLSEVTTAVDYFGILQGSKHGSITYSNIDGRELTCDVYVPDGEGPFPTVLAIHGGGWRSGSKIQLLRHAIRWCNSGFVVVCINYRHAPEFPFPAQIEDCFAAIRFIQENADTYQIDSERIVGYGYSAGGHLIALAATTEASDWIVEPAVEPSARDMPRLRAVVVGGAPCDFDWLEGNSTVLHYWMQGTKTEDPRRYKRASPRLHVSAATPPFFLYHGVDDLMVPFACSQRMEQTLTEHGVDCRLALVPNAGHLEVFNDMELVDEASEFFRDVLNKSDAESDSKESGGR